MQGGADCRALQSNGAPHKALSSLQNGRNEIDGIIASVVGSVPSVSGAPRVHGAPSIVTAHRSFQSTSAP